jgi:hypothetical protein
MVPMSALPYVEEEKTMLDKLRTRGHWELVYRPLPFKERVSSSKDLWDIVEKCAVELGGWRFPYVKDVAGELTNGRPFRDAEWVGQIHQWEHHLEVWRLYTNGQFALATSVSWDWRDESGWWPVRAGEKWQFNERIGVGHIAQMVMQIFVFCSRVAQTALGDEKLHIEIRLRPTQGRRLFSDFPNRMLGEYYKADINQIERRYELSPLELLAQTDGLIAAAVESIFNEFGFKPSANILKEFIAEVRK